jgi:hypothetical protein
MLVLGDFPAVCCFKVAQVVVGNSDVDHQPRARNLELDIRSQSLSWDGFVDCCSIPSSGQQVVKKLENGIMSLGG